MNFSCSFLHYDLHESIRKQFYDDLTSNFYTISLPYFRLKCIARKRIIRKENHKGGIHNLPSFDVALCVMIFYD